MMRSKLLKGLALTSSLLLVISFLCYRAGLFPDFLNSNAAVQTSPNGSSIQANTISKPSKSRDSAFNRRMLPSSKVIVLAERSNQPKDTTKRKIKTLTEQQILSSSKSGIIYKQTQQPDSSYKYYRYNKAGKDSSKRK